MKKTTKAAICAGALGIAGLTTFATTGFGGDPPAPKASAPGEYRIVPVAVHATDTTAPATLRASKKGTKSKQPRITNLITNDPVPVAANDEIVAKLKCKSKQGIPLSGGLIAPPAPAQVAASVISRFEPNPPFGADKRTYWVGVRNFGAEASSFRATLVCAKGIKQ
jgi:hypothetical protein